MSEPGTAVDPGTVADRDAVAIIGMAGRFPGADSTEELWRNLCDGVESVRRLDEAELDALGVDPELRRNPRFVPAAAVLSDPEYFDAEFFHMHPREAAHTDPQHRVFLECAWHALEDAGYDPRAVPGAVGVYAGATLNSYLLFHLLPNHAASPDVFEGVQLGSLNAADFLTTRLAYKLGFTGPAKTVQTACSSSLVAVHDAVAALLLGECDTALAGGVSVQVHNRGGYLFTPDSAASPDGHCRAFDAAGSGTVFGSGCGVVVLRRLEDAIADGDRIRAVILGSAVNNDGADRAGFTAPGVGGQAAVVAQALASAGVPADTVEYVEAHGTGTRLGDPIEVRALTRAFRAHTDRRSYCALGSVKSNIGHLDAAAGVTGLIKAVFALEHGRIPPTVHFTAANPELGLAESPFFVNSETHDWPRNGHPRRAGVSSFGIGGTNAHVVLEEADSPAPGPPEDGWQVVLMSARTPAALDQLTERVRQHLADRGAQRGENFADIAYTSQVGRHAFAERRYVVGRDAGSAVRALADGDPLRTGRAVAGTGEVAFLCTGTGPHHLGMAAGLYREDPDFRAHADECARLLADRLGVDLCAVLFEGGDDTWVDRPDLLLPAIFTVDYALARTLIRSGVRPRALLGHSIGEYVAACLAGVFSLADALTLVAARGELFGVVAGATMTVGLPEEELRPLLGEDLSVAAVNAPASCAVAGPAEAVHRLGEVLAGRGVSHRVVPFPSAPHSVLVEPELPRFRQVLAGVRFHPPKIPFVSNVTGTWADDQVTGPDYWVRHLRETVRFADGVRTVAEVAGVLAEVGPGLTLTRLARLTLAGTDRVVVPVMRHPDDARPDAECFAAALGELWANGVAVDWSARHGRRRRTAFPPYPFQRARHWIDARAQRAPSPKPAIEPAVAPETATAPETAVAPEPAMAAGSNRTAEVATRIAEILGRVSGLPADRISRDTNLFGLGFDSVALVEAAMAINEVFATTVPVRAMFERLSTVDALAEHIAAQLPPSPDPEPAAINPVAITAVAVGSADSSPPPSDASSTSDVVTVVRQQLEALRRQSELQHEMFTRQLAALSGGTVPAPVAPAPALAEPAKPEQPERLPSVPSLLAEPPPMNDRQRDHLTRLVARYTARTRRSRDRTDASRLVRANFRNRENLRPDLKELVYPIFAERGEGGRIRDLDGNEYVDLTMGFGALMFGHRPPFIDRAVAEELRDGQGMMIGPCTAHADEVAELISELTGTQRVAFFTSGTQAVMVAIRLARAATGRNRIVVFSGAFHGTYDATLVRRDLLADRTGSLPVGPGIPVGTTTDVIVVDYCKPAALDMIRRHAGELAAVLVEPVQSRMPGMDPGPFLAELREITTASGTALIFDEVITGFRLHPGGAQAMFGVHADLVTYGKVVGGGMPIGVVAGDARFMDGVDGGVWRYGDSSMPPNDARRTITGGTFCEHPLAMVAAKAVLTRLRTAGPGLQERLNARADELVVRLRAVISAEHAPVTVTNFGSIVRMTVGAELELFYYHLIEKGVYLWEGRTLFLSTAHTEADLDHVVNAVRDSLRELRAGGFLPELPEPVSVPLTDEQQQLWAHAAIGGDAEVVFHDSAIVSIVGDLNVTALRAAVAEVCNRHEALRASVSEQDDSRQPVQVVHPTVEVDVPVLDWTGQDRPTERLDEWLERQIRCPFNWRHAPLLRATVIRTGPQRHEFVVVAHHLMLDGWSWNVVLDDVFAAYRAPNQPRQDPARLVDFVRWRQEQLAGPAGTAALAYWRRVLADPPAPLALPATRIGPAGRVHAAGRHQRYVDADLLSRLTSVARQHQATVPMLLLAAFTVLLYRLTGRDDLLFGLPTAGQLAMGAPDLVGCCDNVLPVRVRIESSATFADHLAGVRGVLGDVYEHQGVSFAGLVATAERAASPLPPSASTILFNVDKSVTMPTTSGFELSVRPGPMLFARQELGLNAVDVGGELRLDFDYDADLFDRSVCGSWLAGYVALLREIADRPGGLLDELAGTTTTPEFTEPPISTAIAGLDQSPERIAVEFADGTWTVGELAAASRRVAGRLGAQGVGPGSVVAVRTPLSIGFAVDVLGALCSGASITFAARDVDVVLDGTPDQATELAELSAPEPDSPAWLLGQGGLSHRELAAHAGALAVELGVPPGGVHAFCGNEPELVAERLIAALAHGHTLSIVDCSDEPGPTTLMKRLAATNPDVVELPRGWAPSATIDERLPVRRLVLTGDPETRERGADQAFLAEHVCRSYWSGDLGLTLAFDAGDVDPTEPALPLDRPLCALTVHGRAGRIVDPGVPGEVHVWLRGTGGRVAHATGFRGWLLPDGRVALLGRSAEIRGRTVWLRALTATVDAVPGVLDAAVLDTGMLARPGTPSPQLVALAVPDSTDPAADHDALVRRCRAAISHHLPDGYLPHAIAVVPQLPRDWAGRLRADDLDLDLDAVVAAEPVSSADPVTAGIAAIWSEVLEIARVDLTDNLFDLGGTSLVAARLMARVEREFGVRLVLRDVFARPTVAGLAELVREAGTTGVARPAGTLDRLPRDGSPFPLSYAQQRLWYIEQLGGGASYVVFGAVRLRGPLDVAALRRAFAALVDRHEALRTRFTQDDGVPVQLVLPSAVLELPVTDLSGRVPDEREAEVRRLAGIEQDTPFDLTGSDPLLRVRLLVLAGDEHVLTLAAHHIICDGWSFDVLLRDLSRLYADGPAALPELPIQYVDYAHWQRRWLDSPDSRRQVDYWRDMLGVPPVEFELPTDRPRPAVQTFTGAVHRVNLPASIVDQLRALGRAEATSLFVVLLAAFHGLLAAITGQPDVVVATPSANRRRWETEDLIGFFVNMLVIRAGVGDRPTFRQLIGRVARAVLDADANQDVPFDMLVDELMRGRREPSRPPLATVMFLMDTVSQRLRAGGLELERVQVDWTTAKYDLSLLVDDVGDECRCVFEYNSDLFEPDTVRLLAHRFVALLTRVAGDPEVRL